MIHGCHTASLVLEIEKEQATASLEDLRGKCARSLCKVIEDMMSLQGADVDNRKKVCLF